MVRVQPLTKGLTPSSCVTRRKVHVNKIGFEDLEPYKTAWFSKRQRIICLRCFDLEPYKTAWFSKKEYRSFLGLNDLEPYLTI